MSGEPAAVCMKKTFFRNVNQEYRCFNKEITPHYVWVISFLFILNIRFFLVHGQFALEGGTIHVESFGSCPDRAIVFIIFI